MKGTQNRCIYVYIYKSDVLLWSALMQTDFVQLKKKASLLVSQSGLLTAFKEALFSCSVCKIKSREHQLNQILDQEKMA